MNNDQGSDGLPPALIATKLHAPAPRRELVERPRLVDRLDLPGLPPVTIVSAPAGFGKTTLLADWFARTRSAGQKVTWLSLDARDNDPTVFLSYLIAAIAAVDEGIGSDALALLRSAEPTQAVLASLVNDLAASLEDIAIVLDDHHVIHGTEVHDALGFLVDHLPRQAHLVIAGRSDPPLPLGRLRARGDLLEVRAADLRFTDGEAAAYLNDSMGLRLDEGDVTTLETRTEGWIAALQLAALSMQGRVDSSEFIASFAGDDRFVVDFLAEEVLEHQPEEVRSFLLDTSILDRFTAEGCDAVTGRSDGAVMIERLDRANLFLVPLDGRRRWYRYHHLFADVLRARLLAEDPESMLELHRRASRWCEQEGDVESAVMHALAGEDHERAADLIEAAAPRLRQSRQDETLRTWLEELPDELYVDRPVLAMALVGARVITHDPTGVERLLELVETSLERPTRAPVVVDHEAFERLPAEVLVHRVGLSMLAGDLDAIVPLATRVLELVRPGDERLRGVANGLLGIGHWASGDLVTAEESYRAAVAAFTASDHLPDMLGCSLAMGDIQIALGRLGDARRTFEAGLRCTAENPGLRGAADMHVGLSEVLIERNELEAADEQLAASLALGDSATLPQHPYRWRVTMARLCRARGELERALALLDDAAPLYETDFSPPVRPVAALRARVLIARGDVSAALRWAEERGLGVDDTLTYIREFEHITLARTLIARYERDRSRSTLADALGLLGRLAAAAEAGHRIGSLIEIRILEAAALSAGDRPEEAAEALGQALSLAAPGGHVRLFLHAGPGVISLLRTMEDRWAAIPGLRSAIEASGSTAPARQAPDPHAGALVDELSPRELDVLRLLRSDLSGPDIAAELYVSLNTLRTHTRNIYVKLGVNNRREAVRRAAELGL